MVSLSVKSGSVRSASMKVGGQGQKSQDQTLKSLTRSNTHIKTLYNQLYGAKNNNPSNKVLMDLS